MCMMMRGVEKQNSRMRTSVMLGKADPKTRNEFLQLVRVMMADAIIKLTSATNLYF